MAPRKSQAKRDPAPTPPQREASGSLTPPPTPPLDSQVAHPAPAHPAASGESISAATWSNGASDVARDRILTQLQGEESELGDGVGEIWASVLISDLTVEDIAGFYRSCLDSIGEDERKKEVLGEALVDLVEVLEEEREDRAKEDKGTSNGNGGVSRYVSGDGKIGGSAIVADEEEEAVEYGPKGMDVIKALLDSSDLPPHIPTLMLQPERLVPLDLHPIQHNPSSLQRNMVKKNTALFYKQSKYNLLRESSEGFSNLIVLLTSSESLFSSPLTESGSDRRIRATRVWSKVMGLIGYFNLSPPRVLDLILEVGSNHVAAHWRFWLDLLRCSPWGSHADMDVKGKGKEKVDWQADEVAAIEQCMQGKGDRVLAQVLGVKFGFCQKPEGGETPTGLVYLAALLLKHGFLSPNDAEMVDIQQKAAQASSSRSGPSNALANSVLLDDDAPATEGTSTDAVAPPSRPPPEQRIQLVQALLAVGHMPAALYFLGRFPWLAQYSPPIADLILRIVDIGIEGVYAKYSNTWPESMDLGLEATAPTYRAPNKEVVPSLLAPLPPDTPTTSFIFFYPDWSQGLERWTEIDEIRIKGMRWLSLVRGLGGRRVEIIVKMCRIGAVYFKGLHQDKEATLGLEKGERSRKEKRELLPTEAEMRPWLELLRVSILPSLSASTSTAAFDNEIWTILNYLPYTVRYGLYGEWRNVTYNIRDPKHCPAAAQSAANSTREVKKALSRVTAAQSGPAGGAAGVPDRGPARALAKLSHANPCALWATAVSQVKSYSNIGQFIVEAGRYMSPLAMDVATFTLVDELSDDTAPRLNSQGTGVAPWLENLATFVGDFNRRYTHANLEPILQFIINRLMRGQSGDLTILQSLISIMSGESKIDNDAISNDQLKAYGAGREMIRESFNATVLAVARPLAPGDPAAQGAQAAPSEKAKPTKKSLARLISGLRDTGLDMPIWIALAQTRQGAVDKMVGAPIKAMSSMQDNYGDLLSEQLLSSEHIDRTPNLDSLVSDFGLDFAQAFQILRPKLNAQMDRVRSSEKAAMTTKLESAKQALKVNGSPAQPLTPLMSSPRIEVMQIDGEEEASEYGSEPATPNSTTISLPQSNNVRKRWWPSALTETMKQAQALLPAEVKEVMSAPFFVIFWHLSMPDISFASDTYQKSIDRIAALEKDLSSWRGTANNFLTLQRDERARLKARIDALTEERDVQNNLVNGINKRRLRLESSKWFGSSIVQNNLKTKLSHQLHQYCFYPRALLTPADAVFVPKLMRLMHDLGTPGFVTLFAYCNFFTPHLAGSIFSCTENEARNLGRCLGAVMTDLDAWHSDEERYMREAIGITTGTSAEDEPKYLPGMLIRGKNTTEDKPMSWLTFQNFYVARFHAPMLEALISCWAETDFMHVKNAITVALQVLKSFPILTIHGEAVEKAMKVLIKRGQDGDLTPDILHQCQAYLRQLKLRQNTKPYVTPAKFFPNGKDIAKNAPTGPRASTDVPTKRPLTPTGPSGSGPPTPKIDTPAAPITPAIMADPAVLRAKLEQSKALRSASAGVKEEQKAAAAPPRRELFADDLPARPTRPSRSASTADDKTKRDVAPAVSTVEIKGRGAREQVKAEPSKPLPTGPAKPNGFSGLPLRPGTALPAQVPATATATSMGPPPSLTADEERAAARAKKFGTLSRGGTPSRPGTPTPAAADVPDVSSKPGTMDDISPRVKPEPTRPASPTGSRRTSPGATTRTRRSRSTESRASERSRRDRDKNRDEREPRHSRDKDRRDREKDRGRDDDQYAPPSSSGRDRDRDRTPSTRGRDDEDVRKDDRHAPSGSRDRDARSGGVDKDDEEKERKKQDDILLDRAETLAEKTRSSRRETESERDERKARERERDRDRDGHRDRDRDRDRKGGRESDRDRDRERDKDRDRERDRDRDYDREKDRGKDKEGEKVKEKESERDKRAPVEPTGSKRKRDEEPPRIIDPITSTRRTDDRSDRDRDRERERERDGARRDRDRGHDRHDDRRDGRDDRDDRDDRRDGRDDRHRESRDARDARDREDRNRRSRAGGVDRDPPPHSSVRAPSNPRGSPPREIPSSNLQPAPRSPTTIKRYSHSRPIEGTNTPRDLTPKRDNSPKRTGAAASKVELMPLAAAAVDGDRIIESPRPTHIETPSNLRVRTSRFSDEKAQLPANPSPTISTSDNASLPILSGPHGLPARPTASPGPLARNGGTGGNSTPFSIPRNNGAGGGIAMPNLMSRIGPQSSLPIPARVRSRDPSPERQNRERGEPSGRGSRRDGIERSVRRDRDREGDRDRDREGDRDRRRRDDDDDREEKIDPRKRPLEDAAPATSRDMSPGTSAKRVKIDRDKAKRPQGGNRSLVGEAFKDLTSK